MDNVITREEPVFKELISKIKTMEDEVEAMKRANLSCRNHWLNAEEVMRKLGVCSRTLQNYRDNGILPYTSVGGKLYYLGRDIEDLMGNNYVPAKK